jgi:hypothetical protein
MSEVKCSHCNGRGWTVSNPNLFVDGRDVDRCEYCKGTGLIKQCPLCKSLYGLDIDLEEILFEDGKRKAYQCKSKDARHEFCDHILMATRKDMPNFSCENCDSPLDDCNCFDCFMVFCNKCNSFFNVSCSDVVQVMELNEEKQNDQIKS